MNDLADVPKVCSLLRCGQPFFRRVVADVGRLCAAVQTGYVNAPACFILHGADAAADGAVFQLNFVYLIHGKISFAFMPVITQSISHCLQKSNWNRAVCGLFAVKARIEKIDVFLIQPFLRQPKTFAETLKMDNFAGAQELDGVADIRIIGKT